MVAILDFFTVLLIVGSLQCDGSWSEVTTEEEVGKVIFANVLFRHGDRTPLEFYPNDPYKNASLWPVGVGQLTNEGKERAYELGLWLRKRYDDLLTDEYSPDIIQVLSTNVDRVLMSAASCLAGMYPPVGRQRWNHRLDWQPIPIHTIPKHLDRLLAAEVPCPARDEEKEKVMHSKAVKDLNSKFAEVYEILSENIGKKVKKLKEIRHIHDTLSIESLNNFTLPAWTKPIFPQKMEEASGYSLALKTWTPKLARLKSGLLIQDMIHHMKQKQKSENKKHKSLNMKMYSAHDSTIANLLNTLGVFDMQIPSYSAAVLMELRVDTEGNHLVTLFYRHSTDQELFLLTLPGCTAVCPLDKFVSLCAAVIPKDWDKECQTSQQLNPCFKNTSQFV